MNAQVSAARIKIALMASGYSQRDIADQCDVADGTVSAVIHGRSRSRRIEQRIAATTGKTPDVLWPQWYGPEAQRRRKRALSPAELDAAMEEVAARLAPTH